ncbi:MAG: family efflux transporter [Clostridia bacterium]|nr:family efflux transporter [Clostridia bacterium]
MLCLEIVRIMKWKDKQKIKDGYFYPSAFIERIDETNIEVDNNGNVINNKFKVIIQTKVGQESFEAEEKILLSSGLVDDMWIGCLVEKDNATKTIMIHDGNEFNNEEVQVINPELLDLLKEKGITFSDNMQKHKKNGIIEGVIWKQLLLFFFPMLFGTFFQQLYNTVDAVVVGRFVGKIALSAVGGTTGTLINLLVGFFVGMSAGGTVIISQYFGAKKDEDVKKAVHTTIALALSGGIAIMLIGLLIAPAALKAMGTPEEIMPLSLVYIRIYFCGMIPNILYNMGAGILRAIGDSKRPLYFLIVACLTNVVLDLFFVLVLKLGVAGVSLATILSQLLSAILVCITLIKTKDSYQLNIRSIKFHKNILLRIIQIGLPTAFQSLMYTSTNVIIQTNINQFGTDSIAAWTAYGKIDGLFWMIISSFGVSVTTFVGQNFGAGLNKRVKKGVRVGLLMAMGTTLFLSTVLYIFGIYIYQLFTNDAVVIEKGMEILQFLVPTYCTYVCIEIFSGSLRGMGSTLIPMLLTALGVCAFRMLWIFFAVPIWPEFKTVIASYPLTWTTTSILFIIYYKFYLRRKKIE